MRRKFFVGIVMIVVVFCFSCNNTVKQIEDKKVNAENRILQKEDGTISLLVNKAVCYSNKVNPSNNTAEWDIVVLKSGRYNVWISSATKDTIDLQYKNSVLLSFLDKRLEAHPVCDKIIYNSNDVTYPYFRADSFLGSLFIQDTGLFNIQVISEKILPPDNNDEFSIAENTKLLKVFFTPETQ